MDLINRVRIDLTLDASEAWPANLVLSSASIRQRENHQTKQNNKHTRCVRAAVPVSFPPATGRVLVQFSSVHFPLKARSKMGRLDNPDRPAYHLHKQYFLRKHTRAYHGNACHSSAVQNHGCWPRQSSK